MTANQILNKKSISFTDEKLNKAEQFHMLISDQYCKNIELNIEYT